MGKIIDIGERKVIDGRLCRKDEAEDGCAGCVFQEHNRRYGCGYVHVAREDGGAECVDSIWLEDVVEEIREKLASPQPSADVVVVPIAEYRALESVRYHAQEVAAGIREMGPSRLSEPLEHALEYLDTIRASTNHDSKETP